MLDFKFMIHHGGTWSAEIANEEDNVEYMGGEVIEWYPDEDNLGVKNLAGISERLGYEKGCRYWFKIRGLSGCYQYVEIELDSHLIGMMEFNEGDKVVDLYFVENMAPLKVIESDGTAVARRKSKEIMEQPGVGVSDDGIRNVSVCEGVGLVESREFTNSDYDNVEGLVFGNSEEGLSFRLSDLLNTYANTQQEDKNFSESTNANSEDENLGFGGFETSSDDGELSTGCELENLEALNLPTDLNDEDIAEFIEADVPREEELHSPRGSDDEAPSHKVRYNVVTGELCTGMLFSSRQQYREALRRWAVERGTSHNFVKNNKTVIIVQCKERCGFYVRASKCRDSDSFQIRTFKGIHTCVRSMTNTLVNSKLLAAKYVDDVRDNPNWDVGAMVKKVNRELTVEINPIMCYRAKARAAKLIEGEVSAQYHRLYDYGETIMKTNPSSMVKLKTNLELVQESEGSKKGRPPSIPRERVVFQYMYIRFAPQKQGYFSGIRPLIFLDGCHLKTNLGGQLLCAIALDGNDQHFPIALACVDSECKESWKWFIQLLFDDYGRPAETGWVFMSDRQKGFVEALKEIEPEMEHRFCLRHMYENFKKIFKGEAYRDYLWEAATARTEKSFLKKMQELLNFDKDAYAWVMNHNPYTWARCYFSPRTKNEMVDNNVAESFNNSILKARDKPILSMLEWIRKMYMNRQYVRFTTMQKYKGPICPKIQVELEKMKAYSRNCFCTSAGDGEYEVVCGAKQVTVNLAQRTCTCRSWQLTGVPCQHAVSVIAFNREQPERYVDKYFFKSTYLTVYSHMYKPVPSQEEWEQTEYPVIHPWIVKKPPGRPKKKRTKAVDEPKNPYKCSRSGGTVRCGKCKIEGHNARKCSASFTGETAWEARQRKQAQKKATTNGESQSARGRKKPTAMGGGKTRIPMRSSRVVATTNANAVENAPAISTIPVTTNAAPTAPFRPPRPPPSMTNSHPQTPSYAGQTISTASKRKMQPLAFKNPKRATP